MNLIDLSIRRPVFAWVLMGSLIFFGGLALSKMGISQMPDVDFPVLSISVNDNGASPEVVESDLIDPIEQRLLSIEGVKEMRSSARQGSANITLEFDINRNVDVALQEVQAAMSQLRLPQGVDPAIIKKQNPEEDPIIIVSIFGDATLKDLLSWADLFLLDQLRFVPGVGEVSLGGSPDRNLRVWIDPARLDHYELTVSDVVAALRTQHVESAAGQFAVGNRELRVRWLGEGASVDQIGNIRILKRGGQDIYDHVIRISDVARVEDGLADVRRIVRVDGREGVGIQIKKQRGTNEVEIANALRAKLAELSKTQFPKGYGYRVVVDYTRSTEATVHLAIEKLIVAALITIVICFLFLGSFSAAINILFSIPTSIVGTFMFIYFAGFTLNLFSLLALTLAISIVVDDAIMLLENIVRHYRMGKNPYRAASEGSKEVLPAAVAATLAVISIFLPVVFMSGVIGKFFFQFGVTLCIAVLLSLLEAVTITPMRASAFLAASPKVGAFERKLDHLFESFADRYRNALAKVIRWKWTVVLGSFVIFGVSMFAASHVRQEFIPPQDQDLIILSATTAPGTSLEETLRQSRKLEEILKADPNVDGFLIAVGATQNAGQVNQIFIPVGLKPKETRKATHIDVMNELRPKFKVLGKATRVSMRDISARSLTTGRLNPVAINIRGPDLKLLNDKADLIMKQLESEKLAVDLDSDYRLGVPELEFTPDRDRMASRSVSVDAVGEILSVGVGSLVQGRYTADGRRYDIRFKIVDEYMKSPKSLENLIVRNGAGNIMRLGDLVKVSETNAPISISRINRQRSISIFGNLYPGRSQAQVLERAQAIAKEVLPPTYTYALEGASAGFSEAFSSLKTALWIGILVAYLILAVQFNSFIHPISVLMALPFSVMGALLTLWIFGVSVNLFSFIGLIVLMGIAKKNSILLVEFTNQVRNRGEKDPEKAVLEGCPVRLRPILMTSAATVAAAIPLVFGSGMGSEARLPMGLTIIGGSIVSTILTLFVVPCLYLGLTRFENDRGDVLAADPELKPEPAPSA